MSNKKDTMTPMERLQYLSLVSKVCTELENHIGIGDKTLAEFVIHLAEDANDAVAFHGKLKSKGAEMPMSFVKNLFNIIGKMRPRKKIQTSKPKNALEEKKRKEFSGLAIPDSKVTLDPFASSDEEETSTKREEDRNSSYRSRSRSRERDRRSRRSRSRDRDRRSRRSRSRERDRRPRTPELFGIYTGEVRSVQDFGAFVSLPQFRTKEKTREGLVHLSRLQRGGKVQHPKDVVRRGQRVKVKVLAKAGSRLTLSMRDVDQRTCSVVRAWCSSVVFESGV